jgi:hypothetical protein
MRHSPNLGVIDDKLLMFASGGRQETKAGPEIFQNLRGNSNKVVNVKDPSWT